MSELMCSSGSWLIFVFESIFSTVLTSYILWQAARIGE